MGLSDSSRKGRKFTPNAGKDNFEESKLIGLREIEELGFVDTERKEAADKAMQTDRESLWGLVLSAR